MTSEKSSEWAADFKTSNKIFTAYKNFNNKKLMILIQIYFYIINILKFRMRLVCPAVRWNFFLSCLTIKNSCTFLLVFYYPVKLLRSQTYFNWLIFLLFKIYVGWKFYFRTTWTKTLVVWKFYFFKAFDRKYV